MNIKDRPGFHVRGTENDRCYVTLSFHKTVIVNKKFFFKNYDVYMTFLRKYTTRMDRCRVLMVYTLDIV